MFTSGLSSNGINRQDFLPYVVSIVCLAVLYLCLCVVFIATILVRLWAKKNRGFRSQGSTGISASCREEKREDAVVYEEIHEPQTPKIIHTSKNMAYCHFNSLQDTKKQDVH